MTSRLTGVTDELAASGVELKPLGELLDYEQPTKYLVESTVYDPSFATPVLTAGQTFVLGHTNETNGIYNASPDKPVLIFDDFTTAFKWVDFRFKAKSSAMKVLTLREGAPTLLRYVYYAMLSIGFKPLSHSRHWISTYAKFLIPVPAVELQREIIDLLDRYQGLQIGLESELDRELAARKVQFVRSRDSLLTFAADEVKWETLPTIARNQDSRRRPVTRAARVAGETPYYGASGIVDYVHDYLFDGDYLLISEDGANLLARSTPIAFSMSGKAWVNNHAHVLEFASSVQQAFVESYLNSIDLSAFVTGGAQAKLSQTNLNRIPIPVPSGTEQERIVSHLKELAGRFDDLAACLQTERAARRKQYEYYRNKLLTFEEAVA